MGASVATVAGASTSARAGQSLVLQAGQKVEISCASGATPVLKGNTVQCGQSCTLEFFRETYADGCDQGGCWGHHEVSLVTLTQDGSETKLYSESNAGLDRESLVKGLQKEFADKCDIVKIKETSEPTWHY